MMPTPSSSCAVALAAALACLWPGPPARAAAAAPPLHVDLVDYPTPQAHWSAFRELRHRLEAGFDDVCPDTFCEGEYSDYRPMKLRCSVEQATGTVNQCAWAFAASELQVDLETGALIPRQPTWLCRFPLAPGTPVAALRPQPLFQPLPGTGQTVFDALGDCLR